MKYLYILFLFSFYLFFNKTYGQKPIDSTKYYIDIIESPKEKDKLDKAYTYFLNLKSKYEKENHHQKIIYTLINLAFIQKEIGFLNDSELSAVQALTLLENSDKNKNTRASKVTIFNHLGILYKELLEYNKSINYYNNALSIEDNPSSVATLLNNIGNVYKEKEDYVTAIDYYFKSYKKSVVLQDKRIKARALDNLGYTKSKLNMPLALENLIEALEIRKNNKFTSGVITSSINLSDYYKNKNKDSSLFYSEEALRISYELKNPKYILSALETKVNLKDDGEILLYKNLNDSINQSNRIAQNKYSAKKYDFNEYKRAALESQLKEEEQRGLKLMYLSTTVIILLISAFLYFFIKSKHKKDKLQQVYNTEARISKKVHDEVANDVFQFMTKLQNDTNSNTDIVDGLEHIYNKTRDISKEHSIIDLHGTFASILSDLLQSYSDDHTNVIGKGIKDVKWKTVSEIKKITIYKVLQELLINMKKHSKASVAILTFKESRKKLFISYTDNGIGSNLKKGTGLQNVENRIASVNGTINFESDINKGFKAKIIV